MLERVRLCGGRCGVAPLAPLAIRRSAATRPRATQRSDEGHAREAPQPRRGLLLGVAAAAAAAAATTTTPPAGAELGTVPLRRAMVEELLLQRLADRLHALPDSQLAELLEQVLLEGGGRFPAELLQQPAQPAAAPWQQPAQPAAALWPQPPAPSAAKPPEPAAVAGSPASSSGSDGRGSEGDGGDASEAGDRTQQLLDEFQRQVAARAGAAGGASDGGSRLPGVLADAGSWRLALLAVAGPAVLIASLAKLVGGEDKQQQAEPPQQQQASPLVAPPAQQAQDQRAKPRSPLSWLFGAGQDGDGGQQGISGGSQPAATPARAGGAEQQQQATPPPRMAPPPPPLPPGAAMNGSGTAAAGAAAHGAILWQRKEPAQGLGEPQPPGGGAPILWNRAEPAERSVPAEQQAAPQQAATLASGALAEVATPGSDAAQVDFWRLPLDQLRGHGSGADPADPAAAAAATPSGADGNGALAGHGLDGDGELQFGGSGAGSDLAAAEEAAAGSSAAEMAAGRAQVVPVVRRHSADTALDNAEPSGWLGRLQRMSRRGGTAVAAADDDE